MMIFLMRSPLLSVSLPPLDPPGAKGVVPGLCSQRRQVGQDSEVARCFSLSQLELCQAQQEFLLPSV